MGEKKSKKRSYLGNNDSGSSNKKQKLNKDQSDDDESTKKGLKISDNEKRLVNKIIQGAPSTNWKLLQTVSLNLINFCTSIMHYTFSITINLI